MTSDSAAKPSQISPGHEHSGIQILGVLIVVGIVAFVAGWPTRHGDFLTGDDHTFVIEHVFVNHPSWGNAWKLLTMVHGDLYQPLPMLTFQANYALAGADAGNQFPVSPLGFHLVNIALHVINAILATLIILRMTRRMSIAGLTGILFACHPFAIEPVAWITGRMILLSSLFSLLIIIFCLYRRPDGSGWWAVGAIFSWIAAVLCKILPSVPIAAAWCDSQHRPPLPRRALAVYTILLIIAVAGTWFAAKSTEDVGFIERTQAESTTIFPVRMLLASRYYFENYFWPTRLCAWSPPPDHVSPLSMQAAIGLGEWIGFIALLFLSKRYNRICYAGLVLFLLLMAPFLGATVIRRFLTADRYMYLPILGLHLAIAGLLIQIYDRLKDATRAVTAAAIVVAPVLLIIAACLYVDGKQSQIWSNILAQARRTVQMYPNDANSYIELARAYTIAGRADDVLAIVENARQHWPDHPRLAARAGEAWRLKQEWAPAAEELAKAIDAGVELPRAKYYYGLTLEQLGRNQEARECFLQILLQDQGYLPAVTALARNYRDAGEIDQAMIYYRRAIELNPYHRNSLYQLALLNLKRGNSTEAEHLLKQLLEMAPDDHRAQFHLAVAFVNSGRPQEAVRIYDELIGKQPENDSIKLNRALALTVLGQFDEAEKQFRDLLRQNPNNMNAALGLHEVLQRMHRFDDLVAFWKSMESGRQGEAARCYLIWSLVLNNQVNEAKEKAAGIDPDLPERAIVQWAFAYDALGTANEVALSAALQDLARINVDASLAREQTRLIGPALAELPAEIRDSRAAQYTLAQFFLFGGQRARAEAIARQLLWQIDQDEWSTAAQSLLRRMGVNDQGA